MLDYAESIETTRGQWLRLVTLIAAINVRAERDC